MSCEADSMHGWPGSETTPTVDVAGPEVVGTTDTGWGVDEKVVPGTRSEGPSSAGVDISGVDAVSGTSIPSNLATTSGAKWPRVSGGQNDPGRPSRCVPCAYRVRAQATRQRIGSEGGVLRVSPTVGPRLVENVGRDAGSAPSDGSVSGTSIPSYFSTSFALK
jgi:hypothetical protein